MSDVVRMKCPDCGFTQDWGKYVLKKLREQGITSPECPECPSRLTPDKKKKRRTDSQKRSRKQEKKLAKNLGGRVQPASGAGSAKGDVRVFGEVRAECKLTRAKSFSLKLAELEKIEREAAGSELPVLQLDFQGVHPHKQYVVMPYWVFQSLMEDQ